MDTQTLIYLGAAAALVIVAAALIWFIIARRRQRQLQARFGTEYDRAVETAGTPAKAEALLRERTRRVSRFNLRRLTPDQADSFAREWRRVQARFVDSPDAAARDADALVTQVMVARGYPLEDFETLTGDLSVDHARVVENYRVARRIAMRHQSGEAGTEELRQAVVNYRALIDDLLDVDSDAHRRRAS